MKKILALAVLMFFALACVSTVSAVDTLTVHLAQSNIAIDVGQEVDVPILISNAVDLYGIDVRLAYDPAVVQAVSVTRGAIPQPDFVVWERFDNTAGIAYYVTTEVSPTLPANGNGLVVTVRLRGIANGQSPLTLIVQAADRHGNILAVNTLSGVLTVGVLQPTATLSPTATRLPTIIPTATATRAPTIIPTSGPTAVRTYESP